MKNKNLFFSVFLFSIIASIAFASSAVVVTNPGASASLASTAVLNATGVALDNCTFYAKSASTANSTWSILGTFTNVSSADATFVNGTFNSAVLQDSNDYIFNATCRNVTNSVHEGTRSGITIDNTDPTAPSAITPAENTVISTAGSQTFSGTVVDATTTLCTYTAYRYGSSSDEKSSSGSGTYSGTTCSFAKTFSDSADNGEYYIVLTASDGTDTASSSVRKVNVAFPGSNGGLPSEDTGSNILSTNNGLLWIIIGIIVVISLLLWIVLK